MAQPGARPEAPTLEPVTLEEQIAHHGGEAGPRAAGVVSGASAASVAPAIQARVSTVATTSNSMWGNLLLSMAYQRDPEIQRLATKLGRVNSLTLLSIAGVSGLGLAQSIYAYRQLEPQTIDVTPAHHAGGSDHVHIPAESRSVSTMGMIGSGVTLLTLGMSAATRHHYGRKLTKRQQVVRKDVDRILGELNDGAEPTRIEPALATLVGPLAAGEFLQLWQAVHR